jgi:RNA polymerase sigma factor (sigma-70 family)
MPTDPTWLADEFEAHRTRLRAVAYRMLGSLVEAEDAVQETWLRLQRTPRDDVDNLGAWLTTVAARISLNMLRSRKVRTHVPEPIVDRLDGTTPEHAALLADSVGLALIVVLETLPPAERVAFVLHDIFDMPFEKIASIVEKSPDATRQLASRARRRVRDRNALLDDEPAVIDTHRSVVAAFLAAAQDGDYDRLVAVLDPEVVLRNDPGPSRVAHEIRGAEKVARGAKAYSRPGLERRLVLVNGIAGIVGIQDGIPISVMAVTVRDGMIVELNILDDPERIARLDLAAI